MDQFVLELVKQAPGVAAVIIVVIMFLRAQKDRDDLMERLIAQIENMENLLIAHDTWERAVWLTDHKRTIAKKKIK